MHITVNAVVVKMSCIVNHLKIFLVRKSFSSTLYAAHNLHTSSALQGVRHPGQNKIIKAHSDHYSDVWTRDLEAWSDNNKILYPPSESNELMRPAEIYHGRAFVRHSPKKMSYVSKIIINMNIDEAIAQLGVLDYKASKIIVEVLEEAQELAVKEHNVEFKSNLHVASSFVRPAGSRKIIRWHSMGLGHMNQSKFTHFYLLLREGQSPIPTVKTTAYGAAIDYLNSLRNRTIVGGL